MNTPITATTTVSSNTNSMTATTTLTQLHPTINLEPITFNLKKTSESENEIIHEPSSASPVRSFIIHSRPSLSSVYYTSNLSADEDDLIGRSTTISNQNMQINQVEVEKDNKRVSNEFTLESNQNDGQEVLLNNELTTPRHLQTESEHQLHLTSSSNSNLILSSLKSNKNSIIDRQQQIHLQQNQQNLNRPSPPRIQTPDLGIPFSSQNLKSTLEHPNHHNVQSNSNSIYHHQPTNPTAPNNHNNLISSTSPKISFTPTKLSNQISSLHHSILSNQSTYNKTSSISTSPIHDQTSSSSVSTPLEHQTQATNTNTCSFPRTLNKLEPTQSSTIPRQNPSSSSSFQPKLSSQPSPINLSHSAGISSQPFPSTHTSNHPKPSINLDASQITPQRSLEHLEHPEHSESPLAPAPRHDPPDLPVTSTMTPAQKIAREVRRSFSLAASPPALHHTSQNSHVERNNNLSSSLPQPIDPASISSSEPALLDPSNHSLTPAQAVAHQARLMSTTLTNVAESVTASTSSVPVTQATSNSIIASSSALNPSSDLAASFCKLKLKKALTPSKTDLKVSLTKSETTSPNTNTPEPAFRVISGRKGHPGDGKDQTAIVRPLDTGPNAEKVTELKVVKACSSGSIKLPLHNSGSHPPGPTSPKATAFPTSPRLLPSVQVVEPSPSPVRPGSTTLAPSPASPPLAPLVLDPADNPPLIPLAVFPTYNEEEEDSGSVDFTDPEAEITEEEEEEESEEEEDYDSNPLYIVLSTSLSPRLKDAYDSAKLVLLPTRRALPLDMPRKLPDPSIEFESEWEQWIAAHTFVGAGPDNASSGSKETGKGGVEWVGLSKSEDRRVHLSLKPGTGIAEVRLTMSRPGPSSATTTTPAVLSLNKPIATTHRTEAGTESDLTAALRTAPDFDPQRTIRAKEPHNLPDPIPVSNRFSNVSTVTSDLTNTTSCSSSSAARSNLLRSPSAATDSSLPFTQSSSGVSRTSSEGWSDMPTTPPINPDVIAEKSDQIMGFKVETVTHVQYAKIISEETMYRSPPRRVPSPAVALESALSGSKAKKGKEVEQRLRFKAPKWLRPGAAQKEKERERERRENALALARERERERLRLLEGEDGGGLERVRLISLKGPVIERWWQSPVSDSIESVTETETENGAVVPFPCQPRTPTLASPLSGIAFSRSSISLSRRSTHSSSLRMIRRSSSTNTKDSENTKKEIRRRSRRMPSGLSILRHGSSSTRPRSLLADLSFLLSPPDEFGEVSGILKRYVGKMWSISKAFNESIGYFKGCENHLLVQLKQDLFLPVSQGMQDDLRQYGNETVVKWVNEDWDRFESLIENVLMAFLHPSLYTKGVASHFAGEDDYLDTILHNYRKREIPLSEFAIEVPMRLQDESILSEAIEKLNQLRPLECVTSSPSPLSPEVLQRLFVAMDTSEEQTVLGVLMAKTPLESIGIMKQTIDCLVMGWTEHATKAGVDEEARRLTPDDLLALLACVIVRSGVEQQHSLIHYAKVFRLGATLTPETDWAFVSYQAAIAYLQSDPFSAVDSRSVNSQAGSVNSMPSSPSLGPGWTRRRPASFTPRTRPIPTHGNSSVVSTTLSSPSASSIRLSSSTDQSSMISSRVLPRHRPRPMGISAGTGIRVSEAPRHLAGKVPPTRPALAPISTTDRCTRRSLDLGMLSAPMESGESRACSVGWESLRSLTSIGETDPPTIRGGPSRSFHFPYSGPDVHPLSLERRNTSDWSDTGGGGANREGWLEWGRKRLTSVTSLQMMGVGNGVTNTNGLNGNAGSLTPAMAALTRAKAQSTNEEEEEKEEKEVALRVRPKSLMSLGSLTTTTTATTS